MIDPDVFEFNQDSQTIKTYTYNRDKIGIHEFTLTMAYDIFDPVFHTFDFEIEIIDPCLNHAILTPATQVDPPSYYYTGNNPAAEFNLAPFGIEPINFCTISHSCAVKDDPLLPTIDLCTIIETATYTTKG